MADLRLQPRIKPFVETGSAFDATDTSKIKLRAGGINTTTAHRYLIF